MIKKRSEKEKIKNIVSRTANKIKKGYLTKENTIFIVAHDILGLGRDRYEVVQINMKEINDPEKGMLHIIETFETEETARLCKDYLVDLLYLNFE